MSTFLAEGSVVGTRWRCTQNGLSQTTEYAVGSVWDPKGEVCRTNPKSDLITACVWGNKPRVVAPKKVI